MQTAVSQKMNFVSMSNNIFKWYTSRFALHTHPCYLREVKILNSKFHRLILYIEVVVRSRAQSWFRNFIWILSQSRQSTSEYAAYVVSWDFMAQRGGALGLVWLYESPPSTNEAWFYVPVNTIRGLSLLSLLFLFSSRDFPTGTSNFPCPPKPTPSNSNLNYKVFPFRREHY